MPISDPEFNALKSRVDMLEVETDSAKSEILTLKNGFLLLQSTTANQYKLAMDKIAALEEKDKAIEQRMDGADRRMDAIDENLSEISTKTDLDRLKINRLEKQRKGLL